MDIWLLIFQILRLRIKHMQSANSAVNVMFMGFEES